MLISNPAVFEIMFKHPPAATPQPFETILDTHPSDIPAYVGLHQVIDKEGRYLHYDQLRYRIPKGLDHTLAWSVVKMARQSQLLPVIELGEPAQPCWFLSTPAIQRAVSLCDQRTTTAVLRYMTEQIGEGKQIEYLLNDLIDEEAISSSQLEGSSTTTKVAKDLLSTQRGARTPDEKMIIGNFRMMQCAWERRAQPLSLQLICDLHREGVEGIDDDHYRPGALRNSDEVIVGDGQGGVAHQPPPAVSLEARLASLIGWDNSDPGKTNAFGHIHPVVKAIIIHFAVGYEHPFHDGNGRVARSLFYWYLFKEGFGAFRYIAISTLLKRAPVKYGMSYLYTETDDMDLTYFIDYQCRLLTEAIELFQNNYDVALRSIREFEKFLYNSGLYGKLSEKQRMVFNVANSNRARHFTVNNVKANLDCSYNTAASVLNGLVKLKLFRKRKEGKLWVYSMLDPKHIQEAWV
jgi:Fic family protein